MIFAKHRIPSREEFPVGIAELGKTIGADESVSPTWTRRLVVADPGGQWCLLVEECGGNLKPYDPNYTTAIPVAYDLAEGVALLRDPLRNPEEELTRRRAGAKAKADEIAAEQAEKIEAEKRKRAEAAQLEIEKQRFQAEAWSKAEPWRRGLYSLAVKINEREPEIASALREIAADRFQDFPRVPWWRSS